MRVTDLIAEDHRHVGRMFLDLERMDAADGAGRRALFDRIVDELDVHARAEEEIFYPAVCAASRRIDDAEAGHAHLRAAIAAFRSLGTDAADFMLGVQLIKGIVLSHVLEEESGIFMDAERLDGDELERLGAAMQQRKEALSRARVRAA